MADDKTANKKNRIIFRKPKKRDRACYNEEMKQAKLLIIVVLTLTAILTLESKAEEPKPELNRYQLEKIQTEHGIALIICDKRTGHMGAKMYELKNGSAGRLHMIPTTPEQWQGCEDELEKVLAILFPKRQLKP